MAMKSKRGLSLSWSSCIKSALSAMTRTTTVLLLVIMLLVLMMTWPPDHLDCSDDTLPVAHLVDMRFTDQSSDPLAGSAPFLRTVEEQKEAAQTLERLFFNAHLEYRCRNTRLTKSHKGGGKRHICKDGKFDARRPCLVYSFGIAYDFTFDDAAAEMGCDVLSFDPSMDTPDHRRSPEVMFYRMGLGAEDSDNFVPRLNRYVKFNTTWKVRTLKSLVSMFNHTERAIDMLKIDVECTEWAALRNMLDSGILSQVKQILVEWHIFPDCPERRRFQQLLTLLSDLHKAGFLTFDVIPHIKPSMDWDTYKIQSDYGYVNTRFIGR